jgi:hypothetical protein
MRATSIFDRSDKPNYGSYPIRLEADEDRLFRFVDQNGQPRNGWAGDTIWVGDSDEKTVSRGAAMHLPDQRDDTLLDMTFPPHPELPNVRSVGGYLVHLVVAEGGTVGTTAPYFEEFTPLPAPAA